MDAGTRLTLVLPKGFKRPKGFPRGELLCEQVNSKVYSFEPDRVHGWLLNEVFNKQKGGEE